MFWQKNGENVQMLTVPHYGHEMGDNIVMLALLIKQSLNPANRSPQ